MIKTIYQIDAQIEVELDESGLVQVDIFTPGSVTVHMVLGPEEFLRWVKAMNEFTQDAEFQAVLANYESEEPEDQGLPFAVVPDADGKLGLTGNTGGPGDPGPSAEVLAARAAAGGGGK